MVHLLFDYIYLVAAEIVITRRGVPWTSTIFKQHCCLLALMLGPFKVCYLLFKK